MVADVRELPFDAGTFDVALDKGENTPLRVCDICLTLHSRDDGRNDDSKGRRLGNHSRHRPNALSQVHIF